MKVYRNIIEARNIPHAVVTIGTFDGVHLGHQAIFNKMKTLAQGIGGETVVVTFSPHPRQVLNIDSSNLRFLCTPEEKLKKFEEYGIDNVVIINFTKEFSRTPSEVFIKDYIIDNIHPDYIVVGYDHHFGKNRMGDFGLLNDMKLKYGFKVERVAAQDVENIAISSFYPKVAFFIWRFRLRYENLRFAINCIEHILRNSLLNPFSSIVIPGCTICGSIPQITDMLFFFGSAPIINPLVTTLNL